MADLITVTNETISVLVEDDEITVTLSADGSDYVIIDESVGPQGPPGPKGDPGADGALSVEKFTFASPSSSWTINHNLGTKDIDVVLLELDDVVAKEGSPLYVDDNTIRIDWYFPETGIARIFY